MQNSLKASIIYPVEPSYILGLLYGLSKIPELQVEFLGSDRSKKIENKYKNIKFINLRGSQESKSPFPKKIHRIIKFYARLIYYCITTDAEIYHYHFPNKFLFIDFVVINLILKIRNKKIIYTAHNIDFKRDNKQSYYKSLILNIHYHLVDSIIVHNLYSAKILNNSYPNTLNKTNIVKIGININTIKTNMTKTDARSLLGIGLETKTILFFGGINPYKGLEILLQAYSELLKMNSRFLLIIAGAPRNKEYFDQINYLIKKLDIKDYIKEFYNFIPDEDVEKFFKAADCCVIPYKSIFQSGVHVLSYSFGVPVIASDVGSFKDEDVIEGKTGFTFKNGDYNDLKKKILTFFSSDLYNSYDKRNEIINWANKIYSWEKIGIKTLNIYKNTLHA